MSTTEPIDYAVASDHSHRASSAWPMITLVCLALGMIFLGGCFCVGLLLLNVPSLVSSQPTFHQLTDGQTTLAFLLAVLTLACFIPGFVLAIAMMRRLLKRV